MTKTLGILMGSLLVVACDGGDGDSDSGPPAGTDGSAGTDGDDGLPGTDDGGTDTGTDGGTVPTVTTAPPPP